MENEIVNEVVENVIANDKVAAKINMRDVAIGSIGTIAAELGYKFVVKPVVRKLKDRIDQKRSKKATNDKIVDAKVEITEEDDK